MSIAFLANKHTNCPLDPEALNDGYDDMVSAGWMDDECYVKGPAQIFHYFGLPVRYHNRIDPPEYRARERELEILYYELARIGQPAWPHFVAGYLGHAAYDPWGVSRCVSEGKLMSKRVFILAT